ncbi:ribonuclease YeeF family protein [Halobacillus faecis]
MKTLQVNQLQNGIEETLVELSEVKASFSTIEEAVRNFIQLDAFEGQGGSSIRSFYQDCHQPFLSYIKTFLTNYESTLKQMLSSLHHLEPADQGYLDQAFMEGEVQQGLRHVKQTTTSLTEEANSILSSVKDIVSVPHLDASGVYEEVRRGERYVNETIEKLNEFDNQQVSSMQPIQMDMDWMKNFVSIIQSKFMSGTLSVSNYQDHQLSDLKAYHPVFTSMSSQGYSLIVPSYLIKQQSLYKGFNHWTGRNSLYTFNRLEYLQRTGTSSVAASDESSKESVSKPYEFMLGESSEVSDSFSVGSGFGKAKHDWEGLDGFQTDDQIGGSSQFTGLFAGGKWDTDLMDGNFTQDILKLEGQASVGGKSVAPLAKAQATGISWSVRNQIDRDIKYVGDYFGGWGSEAKASIGDAKAFAGVENFSVGIGATAAVAEGEVSTIFGIPFTDFNTKVTVGASAGSIGGKAKIGKDTLVDLRLLFGAKIGLSFEKEQPK